MQLHYLLVVVFNFSSIIVGHVIHCRCNICCN